MAYKNYPPRVIINADDFGITKGVNKAVFKLVAAGALTSTSVMSNMPDYGDIIQLKNKIGIGIHFNLTTGKPINNSKRIPSLINEQGEFLQLPELLSKMFKGKISKQETEIELDAQVKRLIDLGIHVDHMDTHESLLKYPLFMGIIKRIARKYNIMSLRTYSPRKFDYTRLLNPRRIMISLFLGLQRMRLKQEGFQIADKYESILKIGINYEEAIEKLKDIFQNLPDGVLEIGIHPGYCIENTSLFGEYIYEREIELKALLSGQFKKIVGNSGADLITFNEIRQ